MMSPGRTGVNLVPVVLGGALGWLVSRGLGPLLLFSLVGLFALRWPGAALGAAWGGLGLVAQWLPAGTGLVLSAGVIAAVLMVVRPHLRLCSIALQQRWTEVGLFFVALIVLVARPHVAGAETRAWQLAFGVILALVLPIVISSDARLNQYLFSLGAIGGFMGAAEFMRVLTTGQQHVEVVAFGLNPIDLARLCGLGTLASLWLLTRASAAGRALALAAALCGLAGVIASGSRGPFLALLVSLAYWAFIGTKWPIATKVLLGGGLTYLVAWISGVTGSRAFEGSVESDYARSNAWRVALETGLDHPFLGAGYGNFFVSQGTPLSLAYPHNVLLETWAELGLLAVLLFVAGAVRAWIGTMTGARGLLLFSGICISTSGNLGQSHLWWAAIGLAGACAGLAHAGRSDRTISPLTIGAKSGRTSSG